MLSFGLLGVTPAAAAFGFQHLGFAFTQEDGSAVSRAGSHPFEWTTEISLNSTPGPEGEPIPEQSLRDLRIQLPPGLIATAAVTANCPSSDFREGTCPLASRVGTIRFPSENDDGSSEDSGFAVFNLEPTFGSAAEFGFALGDFDLKLFFRISARINPDPPYNLVVALDRVSQASPLDRPLAEAVLTIQGTVDGRPFVTLPRSCTGPMTATFEADSWQEPGRWVVETVQADEGAEPPAQPGLQGCAELDFAPLLSASPTAEEVDGPTGFDVVLETEAEQLLEDGAPLESDIRKAVVRLPEGVAINTSGAAGLGSCSATDLDRETLDSPPGAGCPESSKVGTVSVETPLLGKPLPGEVFVAEPDDPATAAPGAENPFDALLAAYVVVKDPAQGILVRVPVEIGADPGSGRLVASADELPQFPISRLELHLRGGPRALLRSPRTCGDHAVEYELTPWSGTGAAHGADEVSIDRGCSQSFDPQLAAGTVDPRAGSSSPFVFDLTRRDGEQNLSRVSVALPPGLAADFAEVPLCDVGLESVPACPAASRVGSVSVAAGAGEPLWLPAPGQAGAVYLSGPYRGAPFGLLVVVPALAGPFDLGTVAVRGGIRLDPRDGRATIDLDPLPSILDGVPIDYRALHLELDRPGFIRNPTSCDPASVSAVVVSSQGSVARPANRFQAAHCGDLRFEPGLRLALRGPARRGANPSLRVAMRMREGEASPERLAALLPYTALLDIRHFRAVCDRPSFAAGSCPPGSIYGRAKVVSPLLDRPLEGPVYLRSGTNRLPDVVVALHGRIDLELTGRIDSVAGRLRVTFGRLPDLPLRSFVLTTTGGDRGLFATSGGACRGSGRARVDLRGQNGKLVTRRPLVKMACGRR